jgi:Rrf2 family protein
MSRLFHISAKDHNAVLLMAELARAFADETFVSLQDIAGQLHISHGYLEEVAGSLKRSGLIQGKQGPGGGYRLAKHPESISLEEILTALEGPVALVDCQSSATPCPVEGTCTSKNVWRDLQQTITSSLKQTTLAHVIK